MEIWDTLAVVTWTQWLLDSHRHWTGRELIPRVGDEAQQSRSLYEAPFVVASHGLGDDPVFNYGNRAALQIWELSWEELLRLPSRHTAEPDQRAERQRLLSAVEQNGYMEGYSGVRVSASGRRFRIEDVLVWNVIDSNGVRCGQAASYRRWTEMPDAVK